MELTYVDAHTHQRESMRIHAEQVSSNARGDCGPDLAHRGCGEAVVVV